MTNRRRTGDRADVDANYRELQELQRRKFEIERQMAETIDNIGRDQNNYYGDTSLHDIARARGFAKFLILFGIVVALTGFAAIGFMIFTAPMDPEQGGDIFARMGIGAAVFFGGGVLAGIGQFMAAHQGLR